MTKEARVERERIVEYIRQRASVFVGPFAIADAIENGDHEPPDADEATEHKGDARRSDNEGKGNG